jgi:TPR repeat protein
VLYAKGKGVPQDYTEAVRWYRLAAEQGNATAQNNLGGMYYGGNGVLANNVASHMWLNIAGANGSKQARKSLDKIEQEMTAQDISEAQRRAKICMASGYEDCD